MWLTEHEYVIRFYHFRPQYKIFLYKSCFNTPITILSKQEVEYGLPNPFYSVRNYKKIIITSNYEFKCATSTSENSKISTKSDYSCETSSHVNGWSICTEVALCQWGTKPCIKLFVGWGLITHAYDFYDSQELEYLRHSIRWSNILKYSVNKFACLKWFWQFQQKRYSKTEFISNIKIGCIICCPVMTSALSLRVLQKRISH